MLTIKQEQFCIEYAKSGNARQAYINAGYKFKNDNVLEASCSRLLNSARVQNRIKELSAEAESNKIASIAEIQEHWTSIMRGELQEETVVVEGIGEGASEARIIKKKPSFKDQLKAGENLMRSKGGFLDRQQVDMNLPIYIGGEGDLND